MKNIIRISDLAYRTAPEVIAENPMVSFAVPFELPEGYAWVRETFPPAFDPTTHRAELAAPVEDKDGYAMAWTIEPLSPEQLAELAAEAEALRVQARERVTTWRDEQERGGFIFEHDGRRWDGGKDVSDRMQPLLSLPALPPGFFWTDADDNDAPVSREDLEVLYVAHQMALVLKGFEIHVRQREMKAAIEEMTPAQLRAFVPGWPA